MLSRRAAVGPAGSTNGHHHHFALPLGGAIQRGVRGRAPTTREVSLSTVGSVRESVAASPRPPRAAPSLTGPPHTPQPRTTPGAWTWLCNVRDFYFIQLEFLRPSCSAHPCWSSKALSR